MSEKKLLFELHGFKVMSDSVYMITDKPDASAPTGFVQRGVTKLPSDGVGNRFHCPYKPTSKTTGVWDSGLYELSPCYAGRNKEEVKILVESLHKNVVEPYRAATGIRDALSHENPEFFDKNSWEVTEGLVLRTDDPLHVVQIYMALMAREVVPKHLKGDRTFGDAAYFIIDINQDIKKRDADASDMFEAVGVFEMLYKTDKAKLDKILFYLGKNMSEDTKKEAYRGMFKDYLEASTSNVEQFNKLVQEAEKDSGRAKFDIYYALKSREISNPKVTKAGNGALYYEDIEVGMDLKSAAENIAKNPALKEIKREILLGDEED